MDKKLFTCGIFIDLKNHSILLKKLEYYGVRGIVNNWFSSYLSNRSQSTQINSSVSKKENICCGVPQGSVLGPLLFLIYINDIHKCSDKFKFHLFADDTNMLYSHKNLKDLERTVNTELVKVHKWLTVNKLTLNIKKTNYVIFRPHQKKLNYNVTLKIFDNSASQFAVIECKEHIKYLGLIMDCHLSWKYHINHISSKISKSVGIIAKLRHFVPYHTLLNIYRSLIAPYINYGILAWGQAAQTYLDKILILQKKALRLMSFAGYRDHAIPLFLESSIFP